MGITDNLNFVRKGADATTGNFVSKKIELRNSKTALGGVNNDANLLEMCEDLPEVVKLLYRVSAGNEDVVDTDVNTIQAMENMIQESLERLNGVTEAKWHPAKFKQTKRCCNGSFGNILGCDRNLVECFNQVEFRENRSTMKRS